jgi:hypothetical protein
VMAKHNELLDQGPREAPEPETAEQRRKRLTVGTAAGGVAAGGVVAAKLGVLGKGLFWPVAWHGIFNLWRLGGWIALGVVLGGVAVYLAVRARGEG